MLADGTEMKGSKELVIFDSLTKSAAAELNEAGKFTTQVLCGQDRPEASETGRQEEYLRKSPPFVHDPWAKAAAAAAAAVAAKRVEVQVEVQRTDPSDDNVGVLETNGVSAKDAREHADMTNQESPAKVDVEHVVDAEPARDCQERRTLQAVF